MSKLYLALFLFIAVLPALNAQKTRAPDQPFITACINAFKPAQTSVAQLLDVLQTDNQAEIVKAFQSMAPEVQQLASQCNIKPFVSHFRSISNPEDCVKDLEKIKGLIERVKAIDTSKNTITTYVLVISTYGAMMNRIPKLLSDCAPPK